MQPIDAPAEGSRGQRKSASLQAFSRRARQGLNLRPLPPEANGRFGRNGLVFPGMARNRSLPKHCRCGWIRVVSADNGTRTRLCANSTAKRARSKAAAALSAAKTPLASATRAGSREVSVIGMIGADCLSCATPKDRSSTADSEFLAKPRMGLKPACSRYEAGRRRSRAGARADCAEHLRPVGDRRPRGLRRVSAGARRPARLGGPLSWSRRSTASSSSRR